MVRFDYLLDIITAIGTMGATIIALWLALDDRIRKLDCVFMWGGATNYNPVLMVYNVGNRLIIVESIQLRYYGKRFANIDMQNEEAMCKYVVVEPGQNVKIPIDIKKFNTMPEPKNINRRYPLKIKVRDASGRTFHSKQYYSHDELAGFFFGHGLLND